MSESLKQLAWRAGVAKKGPPQEDAAIGALRAALAPTILEQAASWFDEEHARLACSQRRDRSAPGPDTAAAIQVAGRLGELADAAASLRSWAASGKAPRHRPVDALALNDDAWAHYRDTGLVLEKR